MSARAIINVQNNTGSPLTLKGVWNDNKNGNGNWEALPSSIAVGTVGTYKLTDNDRAALYFVDAKGGEYLMGFTCPKMSSNSAEGSLNAGLQHYSDSGTPVSFIYAVGEASEASWSDEQGYTPGAALVCAAKAKTSSWY